MGGGLYVATTPSLIVSSVIISGDNFQKNVATSGAGGTGGAGGNGPNGGAGGAAGGKTAVSGPGGNGGFGGPGGNGGNAALAEGGAIYTNAIITILNSSLIQNRANGGTGGTGGAGGNGGAGGAGTGGEYPLFSGLGGNGGNGGDGALFLSGGGGTANGGGVFFSGADQQHTVINTTFGQNSATAGKAGLGGAKGIGGANANGVIGPTGPKGATGANGNLGNPGMGFGGGTYTSFGPSITPNISFVNDTFAWNSATSEGGGVFITAIPSPPPPPPPPTSVSTPAPTPTPPLFVNDILQNNQALSGPDIFVPMPDMNINPNNTNDFVGIATITGWHIGSGSLPLAGCIVNVNTPQLENTLSTVTSPSGLVSPYFYRPLPGSLVVNAGTATVLHTIATAEIAAGELLPGAPDSDALDETLVNPRSLDSGNIIDMGAVQFSVPNSTLNISFLPSPGIGVPFGTKSVGVEVLVSQGTNEGDLPVNGGTVTFNLQQGKSAIGTFTANVSSIGLASATIALPVNLPPGSYTIMATYANGNAGPANPQGAFSATATANLTISGLPPSPPAPSNPSSNPSPATPAPQPSPFMAALELAIDTAALLSQGNPIALLQLQLLSNLLLQSPLPTGTAALLGNIQTLLPQAGSLGPSFISLGVALAQEL